MSPRNFSTIFIFILVLLAACNQINGSGKPGRNQAGVQVVSEHEAIVALPETSPEHVVQIFYAWYLRRLPQMPDFRKSDYLLPEFKRELDHREAKGDPFNQLYMVCGGQDTPDAATTFSATYIDEKALVPVQFHWFTETGSTPGKTLEVTLIIVENEWKLAGVNCTGLNTSR